MTDQSNYMLSGLERELELYMGEEYESPSGLPPAKCTFQWKDAKGIDRETKLEIDVPNRTGKIVAPEYWDEQGKLVSTATNIFKNVEKSSDGTQIYGNPTGAFAQNYTVRITIISSRENSKVQIEKKLSFATKWEKHQPSTPITESTATKLITWVTPLSLPIRTSDLEMELDYEKVEDLPLRSVEIDDLQVGDIIVSTTRLPVSAVIRTLSGSKVSHAVLYIGNGAVVEALKGSGVIKHSVEKALNDDKYAYALRYPGLTSAQQQVIHDFAIQQAQTGKRFDIWGMVLRAGLRIPGGGDRRFYCSELVLKTYEAAGIQLFETIQKRPGDIDELRGTKLDYIGHIKLTKKQLHKLNDSEVEMLYRDDEWELDDVQDDEFEEDDEFASELNEYEEDDEFASELNEYEDDGVTENFARQLHELSTQSFESEYELDAALDRVLEVMENEFMVKRIRRKNKRGKGKGLFKKILSTGAKIIGKVASATPVGKLIKAGTSLVRGDVKGALGNLAKAAIGSVLPPGVGTVATAAMDALGGGEEGEVGRGGRKRRAIRRVARIVRDTYREVADTLPEDFDHPLVANEVARKAVHKAMVKNGVRLPSRAATAAGNRRIIRLRPGEEVIVVRA